MHCIVFLMMLVMNEPLERATSPPPAVKEGKMPQGYLDCTFDARTVYVCKP
jgi:hypothetical protein